MRYPLIFIGVVILFVLLIPIYYAPGHCCGHAYDEGMTLMKIFILGHDSCLVTSETSMRGMVSIGTLIAGLVFLAHGFFTDKPKESVEHED